MKALRSHARRDDIERARTAGTGPDVLDVVSPVLVG
jgi:hypothetical protein